MDFRIVFTGIGIGVTFLSFILYYKDIINGHTKPHAFSWLAWGILEVIGFALQISQGGGIGSWILGCSMLLTLSVAVVGFAKRSLDYTVTDWLALAGAVTGIILWWFTQEPLLAAILVTLSDICGFIPTLRKAWLRPNEDSASMYLLSMLKQSLSAASVRPSLVTTMYPIVLVATNALCVIILVIGRRVKNKL